VAYGVFPAVPSSVREVRRLVADLLEGAGVAPERLHAALLAANELAANAIEHASQEGDWIEVSCVLSGRRLTACISDRARGCTLPEARSPQETSTSGRGLLIVERLVESWSERIVDGNRQVVFAMTV
jgi:anti-sigma regulatory factor (Ser/Thr protein kinase)